MPPPRESVDCLPVTEGTLTVPGLEGEVRIVRDRWGIPHIKAGSVRDAFFAQGFCIAQDRLFQLELYRRMASGTSAGLLNRGLLGVDRTNRRLGFARLAATEWEAQGAEAQLVLQAYADGINAAVELNPRPWEFEHLDHTMEPWSPIDSLAVIKMVNAGQQWASKLRFAQVAASLGTEAVRALIPDIPRGAALITPSGARWTAATHPFLADREAAMGEPDGIVAAGGGSNCWVIHGSKTASGAPLVAGDPHLALTVPGQWYVVHMDCPEFVAAGPCNPCYPGPVFYGHNTKVAWTMTHAQGDRWDLYRERIRRGANGPEALVRNEWEPLARIDETFPVRGGPAEAGITWLTRNGPVVAGNPEEDDEVVAARWGLAEPAHDMDAMLAVLRANDGREARTALRLYDSVSGNFCFADREGAIGYQYTGRIPRRPGWMFPVPGWDGEHEWDGDVPKEELPVDDNPPNGFIVTANNRTTTPDYPHYLSYMTTRFRADRLRELMDPIEQFDPAAVRALQADVTSIHARDLAQRLAAATVEDGGARRLQDLLRGWDGTLAVDSAAAVAYALACDALIERTVRAFFRGATNVGPGTGAEEYRVLYEQLLGDRALVLGDYPSWDAAIAESLAAAAETGSERHGADPWAWRWGAEHRVTWRHNLGREAALAALLNPGDLEMGGDSNTPFNTFTERNAPSAHGVSYRQVIDLADVNAAQVCIPPGNSGQPGSPHYADNLERWRTVEYHPLYVDWADIETNREAELRIGP